MTKADEGGTIYYPGQHRKLCKTGDKKGQACFENLHETSIMLMF